MKLSTRRVYDGKVLALDVDEVMEPGGVRATRDPTCAIAGPWPRCRLLATAR